jgi:hypothetical protein
VAGTQAHADLGEAVIAGIGIGLVIGAVAVWVTVIITAYIFWRST